MSSLVQLLRVDGGAETEGDALAEKDVVSKSNNTTIVDLSL